jgi:hypothetical protein
VRDFAHLLAQVHHHRPIHPRDQKDESGTFSSDATPQAEDHQPTVFRDNFDGADQYDSAYD